MIAGDLIGLLAAGNDLRRVRSTPLPFALRAHLQMVTWLFFILFPLTMFETLGWSMIFAVAILSLVYFGLLDIARELYVSRASSSKFHL
jgi:ion channel-forming bestrophin family protein